MGRRRKSNKDFPEHFYFKNGSFYHVRLLPGQKKAKWTNLKTNNYKIAISRFFEVEDRFNSNLEEYNAETVKNEIDNLESTKITFVNLVEKYIDNISVKKQGSTPRNERRMADQLIKYFSGGPIFCDDEFAKKQSADLLCQAISKNISLKLQVKKGTLSWLNKLIKLPGLYNIFIEQFGSATVSLTNNILSLLRETAISRSKDFRILTYTELNKIKHLNRLLIEYLYPEETPILSLREVYTHQITKDNVDQWHNSLEESPYEGNRRLKLLSHIFEMAIAWKHVEINPTKLIKEYEEIAYTPDLTVEMLFNNIFPVAKFEMQKAIMLGFFLGQHEMEVKKMEWKNFDTKNCTVTFSRKKTIRSRGKKIGLEKKKASPKDIAIDYSQNEVFRTFIEDIFLKHRTLSPVFISHLSKKGMRPYNSFKSMWRRALKEAEKLIRINTNDPNYVIPNYKFKDLRHLANMVMEDRDVTQEKRMKVLGQKTKKANDSYRRESLEHSREALKALNGIGPKKYLRNDENTTKSMV